MDKIRQKISGAMRTLTGAEHGINLYDTVIQRASGQPRIPAINWPDGSHGPYRRLNSLSHSAQAFGY